MTVGRTLTKDLHRIPGQLASWARALGLSGNPWDRVPTRARRIFKEIDAAFDQSIAELRAAGAEIVDPVVIPHLKELMRGNRPTSQLESEAVCFSRNPNSPFKTRQDIVSSPDYGKIFSRNRGFAPGTPGALVNPEGVMETPMMFCLLRGSKPRVWACHSPAADEPPELERSQAERSGGVGGGVGVHAVASSASTKLGKSSNTHLFLRVR